MSELKRTILYQAHLDAGATMVDFGGWDMPIQYPEGIIAEHLYCRRHCGIFDVSHMGRIDVEGPDQVAFLQHVLSSNVLALDLNQAQYCIIPDENGYAIDDAYLYRFEEGKYFLVINAGNIDKDWAHLTKQAEKFDVKLTNVSDKYAAIAVQGPESKEMLMKLAGGKQLTPENVKNALNTLTMEGKPVRIAKTGYTGEPIGYELYCKLVEEAVQEAQGKPQTTQVDTQMEVSIDAFIPAGYITDQSQRLEIYKRIASIGSQQGLYDVQEEIEDRFGDIPASVQNLMEIALLRSYACRCGMTQVAIRPGEVRMKLHPHSPVDGEALVEVLGCYKGRAMMTAAEAPVILLRQKNLDLKGTMALCGEFLYRLCGQQEE